MAGSLYLTLIEEEKPPTYYSKDYQTYIEKVELLVFYDDKAKKYYEMVCDKANSKSNFQIRLMDGKLSGKIPAIKAMKKACQELGLLWDSSHETRGIKLGKSDDIKSFRYNKKACDFGEMWGCTFVGIEYKGRASSAEIFKDIKEAEKNYKLAKKYYKKACDGGVDIACFSLGLMYRSGEEGVKQNLYKAKEWFGKACDLVRKEFGPNYDNLACKYYRELTLLLKE